MTQKATRIGQLTLAILLYGCSILDGGRQDWGDFDGERAFDLAAAQMDFGPRIPGTDAHWRAGDWIVEQLEAQEWTAREQRFEYRGVALRNLVGAAGEATGDYYVLGAHYDTRPKADFDAVSPEQPVPGANDGASGVAVLLELARVVPVSRLSCSLELAFFDAEDSGDLDGWDWIVGSRRFAENLQSVPEAVVIVDLVGDSDLQLFYEHNSDPELRDEIWTIAAELEKPAFIPETKYSVLDDHTPFLELGITAVDIIDLDYIYWHTTEDTLDKISAESLEQVGATVLAWLRSRCP